jgi:AbrB family looped-hinge helix DNA binding protein
MKTWDIHKKIHERMRKHDKLYGTTTLGARGQLVIPAQARKDLGLKPGDHLAVMGKFGKVLGLIKTEAMAEFVQTIMRNLEGSGMESMAKKHFEKMFGRIGGGKISK